MSILYDRLYPTLTDRFETPTSEEQGETEELIRPFVEAYQNAANIDVAAASSSSSGSRLSDDKVPVPTLNRRAHIAFVRRVLEPLPAPYVGFDSTRCWLVYWIAHTHALLGEELPEPLRSRAIATLVHFQNNIQHSGGFGGGPGQLSHLMSSYASVMGLAIVGGPGPCPGEDDVALGVSVQAGKGGWDAINRPAMYDFLHSLKQPDGSFTVHQDGETDVRATYCVVCIALILGIATPELFRGVGDAIANCQTYEGGLSAAAASTGAAPSIGEAHGGYTFCAMAAHLSLSLLPNPASPDEQGAFTGATVSDRRASWIAERSASSPRFDLDAVTRWSATQQGIAIEGGGFRGRTNKLVDGCYGWFSGAGLGTVIGAQVALQHGQWWEDEAVGDAIVAETTNDDKSDAWESAEESDDAAFQDGLVFDRLALQEYILVVAQAPHGGLRDKPTKNADVYHTAYNLSGLSLCQHRVQFSPSLRRSTMTAWEKSSSAAATDGAWQSNCYAAMLAWTVDPRHTSVLGSKENRVAITHPIFNVPLSRANAILQWAYGQSTTHAKQL